MLVKTVIAFIESIHPIFFSETLECIFGSMGFKTPLSSFSNTSFLNSGSFSEDG